MPDNFVHVFVPTFAVLGVILLLYAIGLGDVVATMFRKPKTILLLAVVALTVWMFVGKD